MLITSFSIRLDFKTGSLTPRDRTNIRTLSDMKGMFIDPETEIRILEREDSIIYAFSEKVLPEDNGHLQLATLKNLGFGFAYLVTCDELTEMVR